MILTRLPTCPSGEAKIEVESHASNCYKRFRTRAQAEAFIEDWKDAFADVWRAAIREALDSGLRPADMKIDVWAVLHSPESAPKDARGSRDTSPGRSEDGQGDEAPEGATNEEDEEVADAEAEERVSEGEGEGVTDEEAEGGTTEEEAEGATEEEEVAGETVETPTDGTEVLPNLDNLNLRE